MLNVNMLNLCFGPFSHHKHTDSVCVHAREHACMCMHAPRRQGCSRDSVNAVNSPGSLFLSNPESQACQRGGCLCWGKKLSAVLHPLSPHYKCQCSWKGWRRESSISQKLLSGLETKTLQLVGTPLQSWQCQAEFYPEPSSWVCKEVCWLVFKKRRTPGRRQDSYWSLPLLSLPSKAVLFRTQSPAWLFFLNSRGSATPSRYRASCVPSHPSLPCTAGTSLSFSLKIF